MGPHDHISDRAVSLSRRAGIVGGAGAIAGGSALAVGTRRSAADVELGDWSVQGTEATVDAPPQAIRVDASGRFEVSRPSIAEMIEVTLQLDVDGHVDDLDTQAFYDTNSGQFSFDGVDLYSHRDIERGDLTPDSAGATATVPVGVRIVLAVVDGGEMVAEGSAEASGELVLTRAGVAVAIGGSASLSVEQ